MKTRCFEIQANGLLKASDTGDLGQVLNRQHEGDLWADVLLQPEEDIREPLSHLKLSDHTVAACSEEKRSLRFESRKTELYMEYPVHAEWEAKVLSYVSIIAMPSVLLTVHRRPVERIDCIIEELAEEPLVGGHDKSALLTWILVELGRENMEALLEIRDRSDEIAEALDDRPDSVLTDDIIVLKRQADANATALFDQLYCFSRLGTTESDVFSAQAQGPYFKVFLDRGERGLELLGKIERRIEMLVNQYHLVLQDKSNDRLQILTIFSAIFLPLTLIVGIFGMNFDDMPALHYRYGYRITLGAMVTIAVGMLTFFKVRKWF